MNECCWGRWASRKWIGQFGQDNPSLSLCLVSSLLLSIYIRALQAVALTPTKQGETQRGGVLVSSLAAAHTNHISYI